MSVVPGSEECRTCCLLYITLVNSLSLASSTSSSTVLWCCSQRPERMPRRMTACSRFRSSVVAKPHHELQLYSKDVRLYNPHIGIRELEFVCRERSNWQPCVRTRVQVMCRVQALMCTIVAALVALLLLIRASRQLIGLYSCFYEPVLNWKERLISDDWRADARVLFELTVS